MDAIGVDIGGTKIAAGLVAEDGTMRATTRRETAADDPGGIEAAVVDAVEELSDGRAVAGVGVAAAGFVDAARSTVLFAPNIAWRDHPLRDRLAEHISAPIVVENDANAAGWAEFQFGAGRSAGTMVMLTVGTGLGSAIVADGHLLRGSSGTAGEMGHMRVVPHGHYCGCGHEGCWEQYASGRALVRDAKAAIARDPARGRTLKAIAGKVSRLTGPQVTAAAEDGDELALELLTRLGEWLGEGMASVAAVLDPEVFVVGGGVAAAGDLILDPARRTFARYLSARGYRPEADIVPAEMGNDAGLVGAADLSRH